MNTAQSRFWKQFRAAAAGRIALYPHNKNGQWDNPRHVGPRFEPFVDFAYYIRNKWVGLSVEITSRECNVEECFRLYRLLLGHRQEIEARFGAPLLWEYKNGQWTARVKYRIHSSGLLDEDKWPALNEEMIVAMLRLVSAFEPELHRLG